MATHEVASIEEKKIVSVLRSSLYPGAADSSIMMVLDYCRAAGLDPLQKPVHIVPLWDSKLDGMRDVIMPGIGLYRVQAARTGQFAGMSEPEYGPDVTVSLGGKTITYPEWCRVTVKRALASGIVAEFTAREFWIENYAAKGGKEKNIEPNAMWTKRPRGQIAKCASAQAMRIAFPELGAQPAAEEMEGKTIDMGQDVTDLHLEPKPITYLTEADFNAQKPIWKPSVESGRKTPGDIALWLSMKNIKFTEYQKAEVESWVIIEVPINENT